MSQYLFSEEQVKKALKIDSFRNLSRDKVMEFVSLIPNMDKEVAIAIVNQFPAYAESATNMIAQLRIICDNILESNDCSEKEALNAYRKILDDLGEVLKRENITAEERGQITRNMIYVADRMAEIDAKKKKWLEKLYTRSASIITGALVLGAVILGVSVKGHQIPSLDDSEGSDDESDENSGQEFFLNKKGE